MTEVCTPYKILNKENILNAVDLLIFLWTAFWIYIMWIWIFYYSFNSAIVSRLLFQFVNTSHNKWRRKQTTHAFLSTRNFIFALAFLRIIVGISAWPWGESTGLVSGYVTISLKSRAHVLSLFEFSFVPGAWPTGSFIQVLWVQHGGVIGYKSMKYRGGYFSPKSQG